MKHIVQRTCTEVVDDNTTDQLPPQSQLISAYQQLPVYVLLGDPGAGKTTVFRQQADRQGGCFVTARDFVTFKTRPEWQGKILFIDGLDEIRAGSLDARTPFDAIRSCLDKLGRPRFRLSCREADWFGSSDKESLKQVSPDKEITILHLDSLTEKNVQDILDHNQRVNDTEKFMHSIESRGLSELIGNPQILDMLVKAVDGDRWPETRKQTFELACKTIIQEHNPQHVLAQPVDENQQLQAAGLLCAIQLIAGNAGYASTRKDESEDFPYLGEVPHESSGLLREVTGSKLFTWSTVEHCVPVHRSIAEFLAANFLADCIDKNSLPVGRVLALITGVDGIVVAELRGLSAWLATLCISQRRTIIERDPLGVVLYGDVQGFSSTDKRLILTCLKKAADNYPWFRAANWVTSPFGALATLDMESEFRQILTNPDKSESHQALVECVLDAMKHGVGYPALDDTLFGIIRDSTWWPRVRRRALEVFHKKNSGIPEKDRQLKAILNEISDGRIADSDDALLGYLLDHIYPRLIPASDLLNYLHIPKTQNLFGGYWKFWRSRVFGLSSDTDVITLLNELAGRLETLRPTLDTHHFRSLATQMLARGLNIHGETINVKQMYEWLSVGLDRYGWQRPGEQEQTDIIRDWLEAHEAIQKEIILLGLRACTGKEKIFHCMNDVRERLYRAKPPSDFGLWCIDQMEKEADDESIQYLFQQAIVSLWSEKGGDGLSLELIEEIADQQPKYRPWLTEMLTCPVPTTDLKYAETQRIQKAQEKAQKQEWLNKVYEQQAELSKGQAYPALMNDVALAYYGRFTDSEGDTPEERLENFLGHDKPLVEAALESLRRTLNRDDLPAVKEIFRLNAEGQTWLLSRPYLAGLEELTRGDLRQVDELTDDQIKTAVAFYLVEISNEDPEWYKELLPSRPDLVSEVMKQYVSAALNGKTQYISGVYELCHNELYEPVARLAALPMLKAFPVRCTNQQLSSLDDLLKAALRHAVRLAFLKLIDKKLTLRSMNIAQRVYWVTAGLLAAPVKYEQKLADIIDKREKRVQHLVSFLSDRDDQHALLDGLPTSVLGLLIHLIGEFFSPYSIEKSTGRARVVTRGMNASDFVRILITRLGSHPGKEASDIIDDLGSNPGLARWRSALQQAKFEQSSVWREAGFHHPEIGQIVETLKNLSPTNAGDLSALTLEVLQELADRIRNGSTDDYFQYWNEESNRQLKKPKHEDACRDALLSDLQQRFSPLAIDAQPEGHYADDKRADIRVAFGGDGGFEVPIEIKKNSHRNLWHAIHDQLIPKYTREPRARGFGIYLVFWFGYEFTQRSPSGQRPRTAGELEDRLRETLSADESRKISICVIDVAKPN